MNILELQTTLGNIKETIGDLEWKVENSPNAEKYFYLSDLYRYLGCGSYLASMNIRGFQNGLHSSAENYLKLLRLRNQSNDLDPYYLVKSRATPLIDAIAIGSKELVGSIASELIMELNEAFEYPDDYYYFDFLSKVASKGVVDVESEKVVLNMEVSMQGSESSRLDVVKAVQAFDGEMLYDALVSFIGQWSESIENKRRSDDIDPYYDLTAANICVEGLALQRLSRQLGIPCGDEFAFVPYALVEAVGA